MTLRSIVRLAAALLGVVVSGCAADSSWLETMMVVPGYYDTLECRDLTAQLTALSGRIKELTDLIEKSGHGIEGSIASALAYQSDLAKARAGQQSAERASKRKGCDETTKPAAAAPAPAKPAQPAQVSAAPSGH